MRKDATRRAQGGGQTRRSTKGCQREGPSADQSRSLAGQIAFCRMNPGESRIRSNINSYTEGRPLTTGDRSVEQQVAAQRCPGVEIVSKSPPLKGEHKLSIQIDTDLTNLRLLYCRHSHALEALTCRI